MLAQGRVITGLVTDKKSKPIPNVTISVPRMNIASLTDPEGAFTIRIPSIVDTLVFSYMGYETLEVPVGEATYIEVRLATYVAWNRQVEVEQTEQLLALKKAYAKDNWEAHEDVYHMTHNFMDALSGKFAGVEVISGNTGASASTYMRIRGISSFYSSQQPMIILDGIPIANDLIVGQMKGAYIDFGNGAQLIPQEDIERITVWKGAQAVARFGPRATDGAIEITTKTGSEAEGWGVTVQTQTAVDAIQKFPEFQNAFGLGGRGQYSYLKGLTVAGESGIPYYDAYAENWGPRTNSQLIKQYDSDGEATPFRSYSNNVRSFFRPGFSQQSHFALANAGETHHLRLSYTNLFKQGQIPNTNLKRHTFSGNVSKTILKKLSIKGKISFINNRSDNLPLLGGNEGGSLLPSLFRLGRSIDLNNLKNYWKTGLMGIEQAHTDEISTNNPWFLVNENTHSFHQRRVLGSLSAEYFLTPNLNIWLQSGGDVWLEDRNYRQAYSTRAYMKGQYRSDRIQIQENNTSVGIQYENQLSDNFHLWTRIGGNFMSQKREETRTLAPELVIPDVYSLNNSAAPLVNDAYSAKKQINSGFALFNLTYKNYLFLEANARTDWMSVFAQGNRMSFSPSVALATDLSQILRLAESHPLSFLQIRASYALAHRDAMPYLIGTGFQYAEAWGEYPALTQSPITGNPNLRPEQSNTLEAGATALLLGGRIKTELTYYLQQNQGLMMLLPLVQGTNAQWSNGGSMRNSGIEWMLQGSVFESEDFSWTLSSQLAINRNKVLSTSTQPFVSLSESIANRDLHLLTIPQMPIGQLAGQGFLRDDNGSIIHENGLPILNNTLTPQGSVLPNYTLSVGSEWRFKYFDLSLLVDCRIGGKMYSLSHAYLNSVGSLVNVEDPNGLDATVGRELYSVSYDNLGNPLYEQESAGSFVGSGLMYDASGQLVPNTIPVSTEDYFHAYYAYGQTIEAATFDASYVKVRELAIRIHIPSGLLAQVGVQAASISLVARNLFLFSKFPTIDPESYHIHSNSYIPGYETLSLPTNRSIGMRLSFQF